LIALGFARLNPTYTTDDLETLKQTLRDRLETEVKICAIAQAPAQF